MWKIILVFLAVCSPCLAALRADLNGDGRVDMVDLSILASEWLEVDMSNSYATFNGTDGYISVPSADALNLGTGDFTITGVTKFSSINSGSNYFCTKHAGGGSINAGYVVKYSSSTQLFGITYYDASEKTRSFNVSISLSAGLLYFWAIAVNRTSDTAVLYLNNVAYTLTKGGDTTVSGSINCGNAFWIADYPYSAGSNTGIAASLFDDLRIYKAALTAEQVAAIYNGGKGCKYNESQAGAASFVMDFDTINGDGNPTSSDPPGPVLIGTLHGVTIKAGGVPFETTTPPSAYAGNGIYAAAIATMYEYDKTLKKWVLKKKRNLQ